MTTGVIKSFNAYSHCVSHCFDTTDDSTCFKYREQTLAKIDNSARMFVGNTFVGKFYLDKDHAWYFKYMNGDRISTQHKDLLNAEVEVFGTMQRRKHFGAFHGEA